MSVYVPYVDRVKSMLADNVSIADIATKLNLSERGVRVHKARAEGKMSAKDLAETTGATYRQINYWTVRGYLLPLNLGEVKGLGTQRKGSGSEIMFDPDVVQVVQLVIELIAIGFGVDSAFGVARKMEASGVLTHSGTGEPTTALIDFPFDWKLVREIS